VAQLVQALRLKVKIVGYFPDGVIENLHWPNPSGCTVTLRSTQPLTEMSIRYLPWGINTAGEWG
jgi:hypothetical protein